MATATLDLTPREHQLRNLLLDVGRYIDESKEIKEKLELRFAGGWVRDKILGIPSHDIDTAINAMTGYAFGMKMKEYLEDDQNLEKHALEAKDRRRIAMIAANPEKSKHLETATTTIFGFDVDFVNLRKETYSADSRNPRMEFGTPKEDAERRDATINALFYNLHSDQVEDFEGGLDDLREKRIRTPLDPRTTFRDDPLRVLRLIRFASRLVFQIAPETEKWMGDTEIKDALRVKISRERVGIELEKMIKENDPARALRYFDELDLYTTIFTDPDNGDIPIPDTLPWQKSYNFLASLENNVTPASVYDTLVRAPNAKQVTWLLAALTPWNNIVKPTRPGAKKSESEPYIVDVARNGLKLDSKTCDLIGGAYKHREDITEMKTSVAQRSSWIHERDTVGMKIRKWGPDWKLHAVNALLVEAMGKDVAETPLLISDWQAFVDHLESLELLDVATEKNFVDGKQLSKALNAKPGKWMMGALEVCMSWHLKNPDILEIDGAIEAVKLRREELGIPEK